MDIHQALLTAKMRFPHTLIAIRRGGVYEFWYEQALAVTQRLGFPIAWRFENCHTIPVTTFSEISSPRYAYEIACAGFKVVGIEEPAPGVWVYHQFTQDAAHEMRPLNPIRALECIYTVTYNDDSANPHCSVHLTEGCATNRAWQWVTDWNNMPEEHGENEPGHDHWLKARDAAEAGDYATALQAWFEFNEVDEQTTDSIVVQKHVLLEGSTELSPDKTLFVENRLADLDAWAADVEAMEREL